MKSLSLIPVLVVIALAASFLAGQNGGKTNSTLLKSNSGKLPIYFIENQGVYPDEVKFYIQGADKTLFFTREGITFRLRGEDKGWIVKLDFVGTNTGVAPRGVDRQNAVFSYFKGPTKDWKTGLSTYGKVVYRDLWPGIDLVYTGTVKRLKYEFRVAPGADPEKIRLRYRGATSVALNKDGALKIETPEGGFEDEEPVAWQDVDGKHIPVEMAYHLDPQGAGDEAEFDFVIGKYDHSRPLVLDPAVLVYCGYIGGATFDRSTGIAVDTAGNTYVTGYTDSDERSFPVAVGPDVMYNGSTYDVFVAKVNPQGTGLIYCGYIGGASWDDACGIAVDAAGHAYVVGSAYSNEQTFPVTVGPDLIHNGLVDAFVAKLNPQGTGLVYCGYIGGVGRESGIGIAVDGVGTAYVTGWTSSNEQSFPVTVGPDLTYNGSIGGPGDVFVAKVSPLGNALVYCGYIGGANSERGYGIAVDRAGNAYVTGCTISNENTFPVMAGPDLTQNGNDDAFVAKVNPLGTGLVYCGYIGGTTLDMAYSIAVDASGNAYVAGCTYSDPKSFPVTVGPCLTFAGPGQWPGGDAFVAKVNPLGTGLDYCGYLGGARQEEAFGIAVDASGNAYVTGYTDSDERSFPVAVGPDVTYNGGNVYGGDAFVAKVSASGGRLVCCGYIGGAGDDWGSSIAVDALGNSYVTGSTQSNELSFPVAAGPDPTFNGGTDIFVARVVLTHLVGTGAPRPGGTVAFALTAPASAGLHYQLGSSFGTGPIPIDTRKLHLGSDDLLVVTVNDYWPAIFSRYRGAIDSKGQAKATINIPNSPALIGQRIHTAFVTLDPKAPSGIKSISNTFSFTITK